MRRRLGGAGACYLSLPTSACKRLHFFADLLASNWSSPSLEVLRSAGTKQLQKIKCPSQQRGAFGPSTTLFDLRRSSRWMRWWRCFTRGGTALAS